ncbi:MAG: EamA family transporter [Candidatus Marinimicrobia bacterium]|nr:EamA family transporter [Candidatus Neomarinimicrobiota bacterium]MCH7762761.1 EamA family transporter [Candidatus Neomarinimicrobiota bacterium]
MGGVLIKSIPWPPMAIAGLRSGFAGLTIFIIIRNPKFTWSKYQIGAAISYAGTVTFFVIANKLTTAGNAILLQYTAPIYVALLSYYFLGERASKVDWLVIIGMIIGLGLFFLDELTIAGYYGNIFAIAAGISFAAFTILLRKQKHASPIDSVLLGNILTFVICLPTIVSTVDYDVQSWCLTIFLGIFQLGIPYILFSIAIKHVTALDAIIYPTIEPILNPILVYLIIGEALGTYAIWGGVMVLGSIIIRAVIKNYHKQVTNINRNNSY